MCVCVCHGLIRTYTAICDGLLSCSGKTWQDLMVCEVEVAEVLTPSFACCILLSSRERKNQHSWCLPLPLRFTEKTMIDTPNAAHTPEQAGVRNHGPTPRTHTLAIRTCFLLLLRPLPSFFCVSPREGCQHLRQAFAFDPAVRPTPFHLVNQSVSTTRILV